MIGEAAAEPDGWGTTKRVRAIQDGGFVDVVLEQRDLDDKVDEFLRILEEQPPSTLPKSR